MARKLSNTLAKITEELELNGTTLVTNSQILKLCTQNNIKSTPENIIQLLKQNGWLSPTEQKGVWEYIPAAIAGNFNSQDPLMSYKALALKNHDVDFFLCLQTSAWAQGFSTRLPSKLQVCTREKFSKKYPESINMYTYNPVINPVITKGSILCLSAESSICQIAKKPSIINDWNSAIAWIDEFAYEINIDNLLLELKACNKSTKIRCGYLLQGMRPDISNKLYDIFPPSSKTHFGPRIKSIRNDEKWLISDSILPFDLKELDESR